MKNKTEKKPESNPFVPPKIAKTFARDTIAEAIHASAIMRGMTDREARSIAEESMDRLREDGAEEKSTTKFYDLRYEQDYIYPDKRPAVQMHGHMPTCRDPRTVDSIVIHQTGVEFGVSAVQSAASLGDVELARARRGLDVPCHVIAFRQGHYAAVHPLDVWVNHAGPLNARSLGIEIDGRYPGMMDDPTTVAREDLRTTWKGEPTKLTDDTVATACEALAWMVGEARSMGMPVEYIFAHRQSSRDRRADPGQEIWQRVVLGFATKDLGLRTRPELQWAGGRPVPKSWDKNGVGEY